MRIAALLLTLALAFPVQADPERVTRLELKFTASGITLAKSSKTEAEVRPYWGTAQLTPLFLEATGPKGEVVFARPLHDPRIIHTHAKQLPAEATLTIDVPEAVAARKFVVWLREVEDGKVKRREMLRASL